ncbi:DUF3160 domain-containing protein [Dysgonomonas sp. 521]|uniref:DUF3160 domain-containing protein n=1 Tax=Dysgonomonas sp. 521 TaxID=2302932 RepID=UPI0013D11948|nr:DUF3160 domain-containing protein [Dysgonomonas sp. 521]NDV95640.1 DUF3160 domain-containing protein [Dysgonomonas sp. 521]
MRKLTLFFIITVILFTGCKTKVTENSEPKTATTTEIINTPAQSFLTSNTDLPQSIDLQQDISNLSLQDLRLLRNYPYALHGLYFMEADLNAYFRTNTKWYESLVYKLWDDDKMPLDYKEVNLMAEEQAFVDKIDKRIEELKQTNFVKKGNYNLGNYTNIVNLFQFKEIDQEFVDKIGKNNFAITTGANLQLFHVYEENDYNQVPNFITTDLYLQAFHMFFSYTLKSLEQEKFIPILSDLCLGLYNESMRIAQTENEEIKALAEYNAVFYAIPYYFLANKTLTVPSQYQEAFRTEIANIDRQSDAPSQFLSFTDADFPYSLFKPRGHYTRKPKMQTYFKAMMWLQTAPFCRDEVEKLKQTIYTAILLNTAKTKSGKPLMAEYKAVYEPIVFLVGLPDNLSIMDIALYLEKEKINSLDDALSPTNITKVDKMLIELAKTRNVIRPEIEISCKDKINFMPQRYLIDNDVIQKLVDVSKNAKRAYPKGLDVFAAFGSKSANDILDNFYKEKDNWSKYPERMKEMQTKFNNYNGWNSSIYNKWIESLIELQKPDKSYPEFMQTKAWDYKNLNTSLASWAELKHDAILYGEQPMSAECGDGGPPAPVVVGYVEPNLKFWSKLSEMVSLTETLLNKNNLLTPDLKGKTEQLADYASFLIQVTKKELAKQKLSETEYQTIEYMGSSIEYFTLSVIDPDLHLDNWSLVQGPDKSIAVVADIYTRNVPGCNKNGILHVAAGNANNIYVVVEIDGYLYLTKGATFSYYEFVQPLGTRLTDEEWQKMLEDKKAPSIPDWMKGLVIDKEPRTDERIFYSSGC